MNMAVIDDVVKLYDEKHSINAVARIIKISPQKVRRLLINSGHIQSEKSRQILFYISHGLSKEEIAGKLGLSVKTLNSYSPYKKCIYKQSMCSYNAKRIREWRSKKIQK